MAHGPRTKHQPMEEADAWDALLEAGDDQEETSGFLRDAIKSASQANTATPAPAHTGDGRFLHAVGAARVLAATLAGLRPHVDFGSLTLSQPARCSWPPPSAETEERRPDGIIYIVEQKLPPPAPRTGSVHTTMSPGHRTGGPLLSSDFANTQQAVRGLIGRGCRKEVFGDEPPRAEKSFSTEGVNCRGHLALTRLRRFTAAP